VSGRGAGDERGAGDDREGGGATPRRGPHAGAPAAPGRRHFLAAAAALVAGACARARPASPRVAPGPGIRAPIGFSTLGCPAWGWTRVLDFAAAHGYAAVELRGLQGSLDLPTRPEFATARVAAARRALGDRGLRLSCLGSSANLHESGAAHRAALDEGRRYVDLARALGAPHVRVFGNVFPPGAPREATIAHVAAGLRALAEHARGSGVGVLLESHGDFVDSPTLLAVLRQADAPEAGLLWDAHHTFVQAGEAPEATAGRLMAYVRHVHLKDSRPAGAARRYVLTGAGDVPVRAQVAALARRGYGGVYSFEWEKRWHPEIEEPEVALAHFARVARGYLGGAG
jgi:sugar phosphate isomerase/epimerase